jgi:hypothetical protein
MGVLRLALGAFVVLSLSASGSRAQPGYVMLAQDPTGTVSVLTTSMRRDELNDRLVWAVGHYASNSDFRTPNGKLARYKDVQFSAHCDTGRITEFNFVYRDSERVIVDDVRTRLETYVSRGTNPEALLDWVCTHATRIGKGVVPSTAPSERAQPPPSPRSASPTDSTTRTTGSAFAVHESGVILTNSHVVEGCSEVTVSGVDGTNLVGRIRGRDIRNDLALIAVGSALPSIASFRSSPIRAGEDIVALGFPLRGLLATDLNVSKGIVSAMAGLLNDTSHLQISAAIQLGNSGGPLLDTAGSVVGVVVSKLDAIALAGVTGDIPQNINFAIKAEIAEVFLRSQGVQPRKDSSSAATVAVSDMVEAARRYTFLVECDLGD